MRNAMAAACFFALVVSLSCVSDGPAFPTFADLAVTLSASSLRVGQTAQASANLRDQYGNVFATSDTVAWSSSNERIASVSVSGVVLAIAPGNAVIVATVLGKSANTAVSVVVPPPPTVAAVVVNLDSAKLQIGHAGHAVAVVKDSAGNILSDRVVSWTSSNAAIAAVSAAGVVTGVAAGTSSVTATAEGKTGSAAITVLAPPPPPPTLIVAISLEASTIVVGHTVQATATVLDSAGNAVTGFAFAWSSSNSLVATVSSTGLISAVSVGTAAITAAITATDGSVAGTTVIVVAPAAPPSVASVTVQLASPLTVGTPAVAVAIPKDSAGNALTGRSVSWASTNTPVVTVSITGLVTPVASGTASIVATVDSKSGSAPVVVR